MYSGTVNKLYNYGDLNIKETIIVLTIRIWKKKKIAQPFPVCFLSPKLCLLAWCNGVIVVNFPRKLVWAGFNWKQRVWHDFNSHAKGQSWIVSCITWSTFVADQRENPFSVKRSCLRRLEIYCVQRHRLIKPQNSLQTSLPDIIINNKN